MQTDLFDYDLPRDRIALRPARPRDRAKLLMMEGDGLKDGHISDLPDFLRAGDVLVINDSPTMAARLYGEAGGKKIELLLCAPQDGAWRVMARPAKNMRAGGRIHFAGGIEAEIIGADLIKFSLPSAELRAYIDAHGEMPLPPYIISQRRADDRDRDDYQTIYHAPSSDWGSIAAPTAGLHFTRRLLESLDRSGVEIVRVKLDTGEGTFRPVRATRVEDHEMKGEHGVLTEQSAMRINAARAAGGRIIPVGTTSLRLLESACGVSEEVEAFSGLADLFITPGYRFRIADGIMTNFHLPRSTPLMLAAALAGLDRIKRAYAHALLHGYRFFSYGDACLILR